MTVDIKPVNYQNSADGQALLELLDHYARDPMGGGEALTETTKNSLLSAMAERPTIFSFIAWHKGEPIGLVNAVETFSTFAAKPVCNIHDIAVKAGYRGKGVAQKLLQAVAREARLRGCCKLTLEVLTGNQPARLAYENFGFKPYELDATLGQAEFWECEL